MTNFPSDANLIATDSFFLTIECYKSFVYFYGGEIRLHPNLISS